MALRRVLSVGQCGVGHALIRRLFRQRFDADVVPVADRSQALSELRGDKYDLVLVNRVLFHGGVGLELIAEIKADPSLQDIPVILVSDKPAAQRRAEGLGAEPGFGKAALGEAETADRISSALSHAASPTVG